MEKFLIRFSLATLLFLSLIWIGIGSAAWAFSSNRMPLDVPMPQVVKVDNHCTGFILKIDIVVTAAHCIKDEFGLPKVNSPIKVAFPSGTVRDFKLRSYGDEGFKDYAVLQGDTLGIEPLKPSRDGYKLWQEVYAVGYGAMVNFQTLIPGLISGAQPEDPQYITAFINVIPGDSGSPLFDRYSGRVVGIVVRTGHPVPLGMAVDISYALYAIDQLKF